MHYLPSTIPPDAVAALAPAFLHFGLHPVEEWIQRCRDDLAQLWRFEDCWAITEIFQSKRGAVCHIVALAGEFNHQAIAEIEQWAKTIGCTLVHFTGRKGWERKLPDYKPTAIVMEKVIT